MKTLFSNDYLNTKLKDGTTIKEHMLQGYKNAIQYENNSPNPKFHRTFEEEDLKIEFSEKHSTYISKLENIIHKSSIKFNISTLEEIKQNINVCNDGINAYYELKKFCYKFKGGKIYFQDIWEYCHNSTCPCFEYINQLLDKKNLLLKLLQSFSRNK